MGEAKRRKARGEYPPPMPRKEGEGADEYRIRVELTRRREVRAGRQVRELEQQGDIQERVRRVEGNIRADHARRAALRGRS